MSVGVGNMDTILCNITIHIYIYIYIHIILKGGFNILPLSCM